MNTPPNLWTCFRFGVLPSCLVPSFEFCLLCKDMTRTHDRLDAMVSRTFPATSYPGDGVLPEGWVISGFLTCPGHLRSAALLLCSESPQPGSAWRLESSA